MRHLTRIRPYYNLINKLEFQHFSTSAVSKRKCPSKSKPLKIQKHSAPKQEDFDSLFSEITEILGTGSLALDKASSGQSVLDASVADVESSGSCTPGVCENAQEKGTVSYKTDARAGGFSGNGSDVSETVHKISQIVRGSDDVVSMEERLDSSSCEINAEVVCKVLKRCFKVPHLSKRFFDWVRLNHGDCLTTESYNTMLYLAGEARKFEMVEKLMDEMENSGWKKDIKTWTIILMHYGRAKLVGKALLIFEKMKRSGFDPDAKAYQSMIRLLCESRKGEIALEFYKEMVQMDIEVDNKIYGMLLNCLAVCGDIDGVYLVAENMVKVSQIPEHDVYCCVLKSFCISQHIREALELIRDLKDKNVSLSPAYFENLVRGLCRADKMDDAMEIIDIMKKRRVIDEAAYGAIISGYLRKKDTPKALEVFDDMKKAGLTPLSSTYTELMQHFFSINEYDKASVLFDEMLENGVKLDTVAYMAMVAGHVRHGDISAAWSLFKTMEEQGIRATQKCYSIIIKELCKTSKTDEIIGTLRRMKDSKVTIGKGISLLVISYLEGKKEFGKLEEVKDIQRQSGHYCPEDNSSGKDLSMGEICTGDSDNVESQANYVESSVNCLSGESLQETYSDEDLETICAILSSSKNWSEMQEDLERCKIRYTPDFVTNTLHRCSHYGYALLHFFSWVSKQPGYKHTTNTYNMAIKLAGRGKDFKHMRSLFNEMQRNGCIVTSDTWTIIIMSYGRVGLTDIALRNFSEMKESGCNPTPNTYKYLILSLCGKKGRKVEEAVKLFKEMINTGLPPDKELVQGFFDCLCQEGKLEDARNSMESLCNVGYTKVLSYSSLIRALCHRGKVEEALSLADDIKEDRSTLDLYICESLVHGLLKKGKVDEALAQLDSMKEAGVHPTVYVYTSLVSHFCKEKKMDQALEILQKMQEENCRPTVVTYTALIHGYLNARKVSEAQKIFLRMRLKGPVPDFKAYTVLISGLCEMGKAEEALQVLSDMVDDGFIPSSVNFRTVFFGLNREGKRHLAQTVLQQKRAIANKRRL